MVLKRLNLKNIVFNRSTLGSLTLSYGGAYEKKE